MADNWTPQRARGKRPMPFHWDAFLRDTLELEVDEIGAYMLILGAMWKRPNCDLPNDPRKLAVTCRVSRRLWNARISKSIMPLLHVSGDRIFSKKCRECATYTERQITLQRCRRLSENPDKYLKTIGVWLTAVDTTVETTVEPREPPIQESNIKEKKLTKKRKISEDEKPAGQFHLFAGQERDDLDIPKQLPTPDRFEEFWSQYPHRGGAKRGRAQSEKKYAAAVKRGVPEQTIIDGAIRFRRDRKAVDGYAPDPAAWLHQLGWEDDIEPMAGAKVPDTPERSEARRKYLQKIADEMVDGGRGMWVTGSRFVSDAELREMWELGLAPDKLGKKG